MTNHNKFLRKTFYIGVIGTLMTATSAFAMEKAPENIDDFFAEYFDEAIMETPEGLTYTRYMETQGKEWRHDKLDDVSQAHRDKMFKMEMQNFEHLKHYDDGKLSEGQQLSKQLLTWDMERTKRLHKYDDYGYIQAQNGGPLIDFPNFLSNFHAVGSKADAEDYIARLNATGHQFDQYLARIKAQAAKGIILPRVLMEKVIETGDTAVNTPVEEDLLYVTFASKLDGVGELSEEEKGELLTRAHAAISDVVHPAYKKMTDYHKELIKKATNDAGVWKFPDGDNYYKAMVASMTTTDMTPEQIHNIGLAEVDRIQGEILTILKGEGYDVSKGFEVLIQELAEEERFYYSDDDAGRAQILEDYRTMIAEVNERVQDVFNVKPKMGVEVRRVPEFSEKSAPGAYYTDPALDGSRPGIFWANLYDIKATPKYGMRTLTYHEAVPGHHFQIAISQELKDMPLFRKYMFFTAYVEGWALYAERVAKELGLQEDPYSDIGRLQAELFRAVRLVVDTGMHYKHWTREQAIDYMAKNSGMAMSDVVSEIERYMVWPGQALAYKVGMLKILELREKAMTALGDKFDMGKFHDVVLTSGALPLSVLEQLVDDYIAKNKS
ncbi:DUF885 domain-containing protein [Emcibacter sp.]|uniref:DUF885 domain-containing protein n=1 Tax=Emcibacter sp. TaxID=1979954 RepID=UPI002AA70CB7|nr:DUF885 domain-containing protein [Emcibacter sp.]